MLKFFRKKRQRLIDLGNRKRYLYYAVGEILLVMVGILLALQVNNWNEQRKKAMERMLIIEELRVEYEANIGTLGRVDSINRLILESWDSLIFELQLMDFPKDEEKLSNILTRKYTFIQMTFNPSQGSINSLVNTSGFEHINNPELRRMILNWSGDLQDYAEDESRFRDNRAELRSYLSKFITHEGVYHKSATPLSNKTELLNRIALNRWHRQQVINEGEGLLEKMKQTLKLLNHELE